MIRSTLAKLVLIIICGLAATAAWSQSCPGNRTSYRVKCDCNGIFVTAYACAQCVEGSDCSVCSLSLPGIFCGVSGHFSCYVSNTSQICIDPPSRGRAVDLLRDPLSYPFQSAAAAKAAPKMDNSSR
jgi:hypothetical protein